MTSAAAAPAARPPGRSTASTRGCAAGWSKSVRATASIAPCTASAPATRRAAGRHRQVPSTPRVRRPRRRPTKTPAVLAAIPSPSTSGWPGPPVADGIHGAMHALEPAGGVTSVLSDRERPDVGRGHGRKPPAGARAPSAGSRSRGSTHGRGR
jgi:hypothetical protein